jgi:hypothetical protein
VLAGAAKEGGSMANWAQVRRYALALPGTSETTSRGTAAWVVDKKLFVWERPLRKTDLAALGDAAPSGPILGARTVFTIPHFDGYPAVLVRLDAIAAKELKRLVVEAWIARAPERAVRAYLAKA